MAQRTVQYAGEEWVITRRTGIPKMRRNPRHSIPGRSPFPFVALRVGESFDVYPDAHDGPDGFDYERCQNRVSSAASAYATKMRERGEERRYPTRQIHDEGNMPFVRCFRKL